MPDFFGDALLEQYGMPPPTPEGWVSLLQPDGTFLKGGTAEGPGRLRLTEEQASNIFFAPLARLAWKSGRAHIIDWLWTIFDKSAGQVRQDRWYEAHQAPGDSPNDPKANVAGGSSYHEKTPAREAGPMVSPPPVRPAPSRGRSYRLFGSEHGDPVHHNEEE
jgi:hypothetical protein